MLTQSQRQRKDAIEKNYITFQCDRLSGYADARKLVEEKGNSDTRLPSTLTLDEKMEKVYVFSGID